jgi:hypothetical protein
MSHASSHETARSDGFFYPWISAPGVRSAARGRDAVGHRTRRPASLAASVACQSTNRFSGSPPPRTSHLVRPSLPALKSAEGAGGSGTRDPGEKCSQPRRSTRDSEFPRRVYLIPFQPLKEVRVRASRRDDFGPGFCRLSGRPRRCSRASAKASGPSGRPVPVYACRRWAMSSGFMRPNARHSRGDRSSFDLPRQSVLPHVPLRLGNLRPDRGGVDNSTGSLLNSGSMLQQTHSGHSVPATGYLARQRARRN